MKLRQISSGDDLIQGLIGTEMTDEEEGRGMLRYAKLIRYLEFYNMGAGNADDPRRASTSSGGKTRALDAEWIDNKAAIDYGRVSLKIVGDKIRVDRAHERRGGDVPSLRVREALSVAEDVGKKLQNLFFNGNSSLVATEFDGVATVINAALAAGTPTAFQTRLAAQVVQPATPLVCAYGNSDAAKKSQQNLTSLIGRAIRKVGGSGIVIADERTISFIESVAKEYVQYMGVDQYGEPLMRYRQRPFLDAGFTPANEPIIAHNEAYGTGGGAITTGTRIYVVRFGEMKDVTLATNVGLEVKDEGLVGSFYTHSIELDTDVQILDPRAISVVRGFTVPDSEA